MKWWQTAFLVLCGMAIPAAVAFADHIGDGINRIPILVTNATGADATSVEVPVVLSSQTLIGGAYMASDALDTDVLDGSNHAAYMPGTARVQMLACFDNSGNDETVDCNDTAFGAVDDITLPSTASQVFEFAADNQFRHLWLNISTAAVADWTITWEYYNGTSYTALSNVADGTDNFEMEGLNRVTWDFPAADQWPESTLHSVSGYWVRARVSAATSVTTAPLGDQVWYETGRWWTLADSIESAEQKRFDLHLDIDRNNAVTQTFSIAASADDALIRGRQAAVYPPAFQQVFAGAPIARIQQSLSFGDYVYDAAVLRFDTSSIPVNAAITSATLTCNVRLDNDDDNRSLVWEWFNWENASGEDFENIPQANAHAGTDLTSIPGTFTAVAFSLTNLHHINKAGYTGLRGHISGGAPTDHNQVEIALEEYTSQDPCSLSVTYTGPKDWHYYFPHEDGYTLADTAALEPGSTFHLKIAGYWDTDPGANKSQVVKFNDFVLETIETGATEQIIFRQNGSIVITADLASGYHVVEVRQGGIAAADALVMVIDGTEASTASAATITNNADAWTFFRNHGLPALEYIEYEVDQVTQFTHQLRDIPDHELTDHTGNGFNATARFPDTGTGFTVALQSTEATTPVEGIELEPGPEVVGDFPAVDNFSNTPTSSSGGFWLFDLMSQEAAQTGIPYQFFTGIFAIGVVVTSVIIAAKDLKASLLIAVVMIAVLAVLWKMGAIPGWMVWLPAISPIPCFLIWKRFNP